MIFPDECGMGVYRGSLIYAGIIEQKRLELQEETEKTTNRNKVLEQFQMRVIVPLTFNSNTSRWNKVIVNQLGTS